MSTTAERRNEYSKRYECRLRNEEAAALEKILEAEHLTYADFVRQAILSHKPSS